jgi:PII-like signaling protein
LEEISMEKTKVLALYIGLNDKDTLQQEMNQKEAEKVILSILGGNGFDGATVFYTKGIYKGIVENTVVIELFEYTLQAVKNACEEIKKALNQECIAIQEKIVEVDFI